MSASTVQHFRDLIGRQSSVAGAGRALAEAADALGWDLAGFQIDLHASVSPRTSSGDYIHHVMGWPQPYLLGWVERDMGARCPLAQRCLATHDSYFWTCTVADGTWRDTALDAGQREVLDYYGDLLTGGICVTVRRGVGRTAYVSWCSRKSHRLHERYEQTFSDAFLLSHAFVYHVEQLGSEQGEHVEVAELSARELECLNWAARGKTEEEIGVILCRSPATVHFHLRNAVAKLHAGNRTHAVALACTLGLIRLE